MHRQRFLMGLLSATFAMLALFPALAQGSPRITFPTGTTLAPGSSLQIKNSAISLFTMSTLGNVQCSKALLPATLITNSGTVIEANISSAEFSCGSIDLTAGNLPWCFKATSKLSLDTWEIRGGGCGEAAKAITLTFDYTTPACKYQATGIVGNFATHPKLAEMTVAEQPFEKESTNSVFCASAMRADMILTLETGGLAPEPVYIS